MAFHVTSLGDSLATVNGLDRAMVGFLVEPWASRKLSYLLSKLGTSSKQFHKMFLEKHCLLKTMANKNHKIMLIEDREQLELFQYDFLEQAHLRHDEGPNAVRKMRRRLVTQHDPRFQVTDTESEDLDDDDDDDDGDPRDSEGTPILIADGEVFEEAAALDSSVESRDHYSDDSQW